MLGDEENQARRSGFLGSPVMLALLALGGCVAMMLALVEGTLAAVVIPIALRPSPVLHNTTSHLALDSRLAFVLLFAGFIIMAGVAFALSRRSFRDALKKGRKRTHRL
jgi:hypothetical protein